MTRICWWLVDILSRMLEPDERDAVRGDFAESGATSSQALLDVLGLVVRRQTALWKDWRPRLAPVALIAPMSVFLSKPSSGELWLGWVGRQFDTVWQHGVRYETGLTFTDDIVTLVCVSLLLISWTWIGGFVLGSLSRRAAWVLGLLYLLWWFSWWFPGAMLRALFSDPLHSELFWLIPQVVLILIPFLWGVHRGVCFGALGIGRVVLLAVAVAILTLIVQVEDDRRGLAFAVWSSGCAFDGRLVWTPRLLPFAVIIWQFGFMVATTHERRFRGKTASV